MKTKRLVSVTWLDSYGCSPSWESITEDFDPKPCLVTSVGFLVKETADYITVVPHVYAILWEGHEPTHGCGDMTIPRGSISSMNSLEVGPDGPKLKPDESETHDESPSRPPTEASQKPVVVVEAFQFTRERRTDNSEWPEWLNEAWNKNSSEVGSLFRSEPGSSTGHVSIRTRTGVMEVSWDDWIIKDLQGEIYPRKPGLFV